MRIAIHVEGDWNDAEVPPAIVSRLVADGSLWPSGNTGALYGEEASLPIYAARHWPSAADGLRYIEEQLALVPGEKSLLFHPRRDNGNGASEK